jgi:hypothetical protein
MVAVLLLEVVVYACHLGNGAPQRTPAFSLMRAIDESRGYAEARTLRTLPGQLGIMTNYLPWAVVISLKYFLLIVAAHQGGGWIPRMASRH